MERFFLHRHKSLLMIVDIQERLAQVMNMREKVVGNCLHIIELAKMLNIPILITEQYPKGIGPTVKEIQEAVNEYVPLEKITFDCCGEPAIESRIKELGRSHIILTGMETHICVLQTTLSLIRRGLHVHLISDGVCSRTKENWRTGIALMRDAGAVVTSTEVALFQLLQAAGTEEFKAISRRIKPAV